MSQPPSRQVAVVTGAAHGIGAEIARGVVAAGGAVVVTDIDDRRCAELAEELGEAAVHAHVDVTVEADISSALALAVDHFGDLSAVFANAGAVGVTGRIESIEVDDWRRTTDLLLTSVFLSIKHGVRIMRPRGRGAIVATASVASLRGGLGPHAYTAAKHGVKGLVESAAVEVSPYGLTVNAVAPGGTVSSLSAGLYGDVDDLETPYRRLAESSSSGVPTTARDVAAAALFLASPAASRINGVLLGLDGGDDLLGSKARAAYHH